MQTQICNIHGKLNKIHLILLNANTRWWAANDHTCDMLTVRACESQGTRAPSFAVTENLQIYQHDRFVVAYMSLTCASGLVCQWCLLLKISHSGRFIFIYQWCNRACSALGLICLLVVASIANLALIDSQISPIAQHEVCFMTRC